jgi:class 3 adenylate cyclase/tetratricopeptide (TPR) repeat protein
VCATCGAAWGTADRFCGDCGTPLGACPGCGAAVVAGRRFCSACGHPLSDAALSARQVRSTWVASAAEEAPVAERRVCSVLFCDLAGFTPLSEARDPEAVRELLSRYFAIAREIISRYGGVIEKFIGDAVMAVWGTPVATEEDAERAVRAALDLVVAVGQLGQDEDVPGLAARVGVVTGTVAVNLGAVGEGMVAGDAVNTAARVQTAAGPGQVLVDVATHQLADGAIGFAEAGEHALKGKAEPLQLWRAIRVLSGVGGAQRVDGLEAPLAGRDAELRTIRELFHAAAERRVPRLVLVSGPAGVGKSRLAWEFEKYTDGLAAEVWWHRGRCLSYGQGMAFWALAEIVRQRLDIAEEDPPGVAAAKLEAGLVWLVPDPAERGYVGLRLGRLLGVTPAGDSGRVLAREELFAGWRLFFERLATSRPVILLVEDAQHADTELLDFLGHVVDWVRDLPLYVLVLARPELAQARPGFGTGRNRSVLTLDPLDPASMDGLVEALVPGMPATARAAITRQAQGLPLFAVETIRTLIDHDIVRPVEGMYRLVGDIGELQVPGSLHALLAARLDALDPAARQVTADAAVLGTSFPAEALIAVSSRDEATVRTALAELLRREILTVSADPLSPERGSYQFTQDMLRLVAYETLSRRDRKARHLAVAAHLRRAFPGDGEEAADVIARHYADALHAVPGDPDTETIREQAITAYTRAAERAERTGAPARAAANYATAAQLTLGAVPGARVDAGTFWERAADALLAFGDHLAAGVHAGHARDYHRRHGQHRAAARAQALEGEAQEGLGRYAEAGELFRSALEVLQAEPGRDTVRAMRHLAALAVFAGSGEADRLTTEALVLGQALDLDPGVLAGLLNLRGIWLGFAGRSTEGTAYLTQAVRLAERADDSERLGEALLNLADILAATDPAAAAETARTAASHLRRVGARSMLAGAIGNQVHALLSLGDWDAADDTLTRAIEDDKLGDVEHLVFYQGWLAALRGEVSTARGVLAGLENMQASDDIQEQAAVAVAEAFAAAVGGQPGDALAFARRALAHADALGLGCEAIRWAWPLAARAAYDLDDPAAGQELLAQLDAHPPGHLIPMLRAERDLARARLADHAGDPGVGQALAAAIDRQREDSTPYHLAHGLLDQAEYHLRHENAAAAGDALAKARAIGRQLRCAPVLERANAIEPVACPQQGHMT